MADAAVVDTAPPEFDLEGARKAGYSDTDIAERLGTKYNFDVSGARAAGYSDADIASNLAKPRAKKGQQTPAPAAPQPAVFPQPKPVRTEARAVQNEVSALRTIEHAPGTGANLMDTYVPPPPAMEPTPIPQRPRAAAPSSAAVVEANNSINSAKKNLAGYEEPTAPLVESVKAQPEISSTGGGGDIADSIRWLEQVDAKIQRYELMLETGQVRDPLPQTLTPAADLPPGREPQYANRAATSDELAQAAADMPALRAERDRLKEIEGGARAAEQAAHPKNEGKAGQLLGIYTRSAPSMLAGAALGMVNPAAGFAVGIGGGSLQQGAPGFTSTIDAGTYARDFQDRGPSSAATVQAALSDPNAPDTVKKAAQRASEALADVQAKAQTGMLSGRSARLASARALYSFDQDIASIARGADAAFANTKGLIDAAAEGLGEFLGFRAIGLGRFAELTKAGFWPQFTKALVENGFQEGATQIAQSINDRMNADPNLTLKEGIEQVLMAAAGGVVMGGTMHPIMHAAARSVENANWKAAGLGGAPIDLSGPLPSTPQRTPMASAVSKAFTEQDITLPTISKEGAAADGGRLFRNVDPKVNPDPARYDPAYKDGIFIGWKERARAARGTAADLASVMADKRPLGEIRTEQADASAAAAAPAIHQAAAAQHVQQQQAAQAGNVAAELNGMPAKGAQARVTWPGAEPVNATVVDIDEGGGYTLQMGDGSGEYLDPTEIDPTGENGVKLEAAPLGAGTPASPIVAESAKAIEQAAQRVDTAPTDAQKEAGNYRKGHVDWQGLPVTIETPKGAMRSGVNMKTGETWSVKMSAGHYGYVKRTNGADGDQVDITLGDHPESQDVFVIDQIDPDTGKFDEHKFFGAYKSARQAAAAYRASFSDDTAPSRMGAMSHMTVPQFKEWLKSGDTKAPIKFDQKAETAKRTSAQKLADELNKPAAPTKETSNVPAEKAPASPAGNASETSGAAPAASATAAPRSAAPANEQPGAGPTAGIRSAPSAGSSTSAGPARSETAAVRGQGSTAVPEKGAAQGQPEREGSGSAGAVSQPAVAEPKAEPSASEAANVSADDFDALIDDVVTERARERNASNGSNGSTASPKQALKQAGVHAAQGAKEGLAGLDALFGRKGTLGSGPAFDEETWAKAKPHFDAAFKEFVAAGKSLRDFVRFIIDQYRPEVVPYLKRWHAELSGTVDQAPPAGVESAPNVEPAAESQPEPGQPDRNGEAPLVGVPAEPVRGAEGGGNAAEGAASSSGPDLAGNVGLPGGRDVGDRGLAGGEGAVSPATGGSESGAGSDAGQPGVRRPGGDQPDQPGRAVAPENFVITDEIELGKGSPGVKYRDNVAAIKLLKDIEATGRQATPEEQGVLARYVGWGGLKQAFPRPGAAAAQGWEKRVDEIRALLTPEEYEAASASIQDAHYTSKAVVDAMWGIAKRLGFDGGKVLESSMGTGNFFGLMPEAMRAGAPLTGIERDSLTSRIAKQLYPKARVIHAAFEDVPLGENAFNLSIGNPPFGNKSVYDKDAKHLNGFSIHNFFFAKAIDKLAPGGLHIAVVSRYLMDAESTKVREYLAHRTRLIGAIRLPWTAFYENARTEVVTDIVILQKLAEAEFGSADASWVQTAKVNDPRGGDLMTVNRYFAEHPEMIAGTMDRSGEMRTEHDITVQPFADVPLEAAVEGAVKHLPQNVYSRGKPEAKVKAEEQAAVAPEDVIENYSVGQYFTQGGKLFQRTLTGDGSLEARQITAATPAGEKSTWGDTRVSRVRGMSGIRETARALNAAEKDDLAQPELDRLRKQLNTRYDAFVKSHGYLNETANERAFRDDPDAPLLLALEHAFDKGVSKQRAKVLGVAARAPTAEKMPIFTERGIKPHVTPTHADSPQSALGISIAEKGAVNIPFMASLTGQSEDDVIRELTKADKPLIFFDPAIANHVLAEEYLSGNVKAKWQEAKSAGLDDNAEALHAVFPVDLQPGDIRARAGAAWISDKDYQDFAKYLFGPSTRALIQHVPATGGFIAVIKGGDPALEQVRWGTNKVDGSSLLAKILNSRDITVRTPPDSDGHTFVDVEGTQAANDKADEIRAEFEEWIFRDPARAERLVQHYNDTMNTNVDPKVDGSYLTLPGKVPDSVIGLRRTQKNAIARIIRYGKMLMDHVVGAGKTYTIIGAMMEMRRIGLVNKPMIVVPNHLVEQWATDFYRLYPGAKVLAMRKADFAKQNRRRMLARVMTGDWDAVIFAHSSFGFINNERDVLAEALRQQIAEIQEAVDAAIAAEGKKSRTSAQYQKAKDNLEARLKSLMDKPRDDLLTFQQLGVDSLTVDESQEFKNLFFTTQRRAGGLGNPQGSKKAFDLFIKSQWLQQKNNGRGVVFATGTPISNSLSELYTLQRYLGLGDLRARGIKSLDAWLNAFGIVQSEYEQNVTGTKYKRKDRLRYITNVPEVMQLYKAFTDSVSLEDLKRTYKEDTGKDFPIPLVKSRPKNRQNVVAPRSDLQAALSEELQWRMEHLPPGGTPDNALKVLSDGRKGALDMRLIDPNAPDNPEGKTHLAAKEIARLYNANTYRKGTQLVFLDLSTPFKHAQADANRYLRQARELLGDKNAAPLGTLSEQWDALKRMLHEKLDSVDEHANPADADVIEKLEKFLEEAPEAEAAASTADSKFSVYDDMRSKLVGLGLPESEIAFIHDYNSDAQKQELFDMVNAGTIRVVLGSTAKMGAGTNVQAKLVALHHLDVPWRPSDVEQREGRIIRQKNEFRDADPNFEVEILAYATEATSDTFMWQIQEQKNNGINSIRNYHGEREIAEVNNDSMTAAEMRALSSGNPLILEDVQLTEAVRKLEAQKRRHTAGERDMQGQITKYERAIANLPAEIERLSAARAQLDAYDKDPYAGQPPTVEVDGEKLDPKAALEHVAKVQADAEEAVKAKNTAEFGASEAELQAEAGLLDHASPQYKALEAKFLELKKKFHKAEWKVTIAGTEYTSRDGARTAIEREAGDTRGFRMVVSEGGQPVSVYRASDVANRLDPIIAKMEKDGKGAAEIGIYAGLPVTMEWQPSKSSQGRPGIAVDMNGDTRIVEEIASRDRAGNVVLSKITGMRVVHIIERIADDMKYELESDRARLKQAQDGLAPLKDQTGKAWGKDTELEEKKARLAEVRKTLAADTTQDTSEEHMAKQSAIEDRVMSRRSGVHPAMPQITWRATQRAKDEEAISAPEEIADEIEALAREIAPQVNVEAVGRLIITLQSGGQVEALGGYYEMLNLIRVAVASTDPNKIATFRHEVVHALRALNLFTPAEWAVLEREAARWRKEYGIEERYKDVYAAGDEESRNEEAIADAFAYHPYEAVRGNLGRAFEKIRQFLFRLGSLLRGHGYTASSDIFAKIMSGEVGRRQVGIPTEDVAAAKPALPLAPQPGQHTFDDADTERRFREAQRGLGVKGLRAAIMEKLAGLVHGFTRHFKELPHTPEFAKAYDALRVYEAAPEAAKLKAQAMLDKITKGLTTAEYDLFNRKVVMDDLAFEADEGHDLPFGLSAAAVKLEGRKIDALLTPKIRDRLDIRTAFIKEVTDDLLNHGILKESQVKNPAYFRHQVLVHAMDWTFAQGAGRKMKKPRPGYAMKRRGSIDDINANYLEAEFEFLHRALIDVAAVEAIRKIGAAYDKKASLVAEAKRQNRTLPAGAQVKWKDLIPAGYTLWQADKGNQFFTGRTIGEQAIDKLLDQIASVPNVDGAALTEVVDSIKNALIVGARKREFVIPDELAATLDSMRPEMHHGAFDLLVAEPLKMWKQWVLINPRRILRYNLNNLSGDLDAVWAGNPQALKDLWPAMRELWDVMHGKEWTDTYRDALDRGVFNGGLTAQEIPDINYLKQFEHLLGEASLGKKALRIPARLWRGLKDYTQFRENWLRYAAYLNYVKRMEAGESMQSIGYGASSPKFVDQITDTKDRAALIARELVGDYGSVSHFGQGIRKYAVPFYSWLEINFKRYSRLISNAFAQGIGQGIKTAGVLGAVKGAHVTAWLGIRMAMMYTLVMLYNYLFHRDAEDDLDVHERARLHLNLGYDADGKVRLLRFQGALSDYLDWFGFSDAVATVAMMERGKVGWTDIVKAIAKAPVNKIAQGITPLITTPFELGLGVTFYPDVFNARGTRDQHREAARIFSLENEYDWLTGKPSRGYGNSLLGAVITKQDPGENAYYRTKKAAGEFLDKTQGREGFDTGSTAKSRALYEWRQAIRLGDKPAEDRALEKLKIFGKVDIPKSIQAASPLGGLSSANKGQFVDQLSPLERRDLDKAMAWYEKTYLGEKPSAPNR